MSDTDYSIDWIQDTRTNYKLQSEYLYLNVTTDGDPLEKSRFQKSFKAIPRNKSVELSSTKFGS